MGLLSACGSPPVDPPTAVVRADPASVCLNDNHATDVHLSGADSTPGISLVPVERDEDASLAFEWALSGAEHRVVSRDPTGVELVVTTKGDRPLHVELTVENAAGGRATTLLSLPITLPGPGVCEK